MIFTKKMKRLLIFSAVLLVAGILLCLMGYITAKGEDASLFDQIENEDGNYVRIEEFDPASIKKISLDIKYAEVNVIGGAETDRIELINFANDRYDMTVSATTIAIEETSALSGLFGFGFDGLRNYINSVKVTSRDKTVNIYLTDASDMRLIDISLYSGDVRATGVSVNTDFNIDLEYGSVLFEEVNTEGNLVLDILEGNLDIKSSNIFSNTSKLSYGYESIERSKVTRINAEIDTGYFKCKTEWEPMLASVMRLSTDEGKVRFGGDIYENGSFSQGIKYTGITDVVQTVFEIHIAKGNIMITE